MIAKPLPSLPEIHEGQVWQCRNQLIIAKIPAFHIFTYARLHFTSGDRHYIGTCEVRRVVNAKEASYRLRVDRRSAHDLLVLLYDPRDL